jgi:hypothetical protein
LLKEKQEIDDLFNRVNGFTGDPYIKSLLTYYLCIRVSGFLENCIRIIFTDYSIPRTRDNVQTFVTRRLGKFPNPTYSNICNLAKAFSYQWNTNFKSNITAQIRQSLEAINVNRNAIAHGGTSTITVRQLASYYQDIVQLIEELEQACI